MIQDWVVVSNIFYFHPYLEKWSQLTNIFQMGWNHQLEEVRDLGLAKTLQPWYFFSFNEGNPGNNTVNLAKPTVNQWLGRRPNIMLIQKDDVLWNNSFFHLSGLNVLKFTSNITKHVQMLCIIFFVFWLKTPGHETAAFLFFLPAKQKPMSRQSLLLLMAAILHHLTCMKPCKQRNIYHKHQQVITHQEKTHIGSGSHFLFRAKVTATHCWSCLVLAESR